MENVQTVEAILNLIVEVVLLCFCVYIFAIKNKTAGVLLTIYSIHSLLTFLLLQGALGEEFLKKIFYAGDITNTYLALFGISGSLAKISLLAGIYLLAAKFVAKDSTGNDS